MPQWWIKMAFGHGRMIQYPDHVVSNFLYQRKCMKPRVGELVS